MKKFLIVSFAGLAFVSLAAASPIVCATSGNLQAVITAGGCTLGDLLFNNIVYQNNQLLGTTPAQIAASGVGVFVGTQSNANGSISNTLNIQAGWSARSGQNLQIIFNYTVTSITAPIAISGLGSGYSATGPNAVGQSKCVSGCPGSPRDFSGTTIALSPTVATLSPLNITNTFTLGPGAIGAVNHVSIITNSVMDVIGVTGGQTLPEPGPMSLVLSGMLALVGTRYWKKKKTV